MKRHKMEFPEPLQLPVLVNWNGKLIVGDEGFFPEWKIRHEGGSQISYPKSSSGNKALIWILTRDGRCWHFNETHMMNAWANFLSPIYRVTRVVGNLSGGVCLTKADLLRLLESAIEDDPELNFKSDLIYELTQLEVTDLVDRNLMDKFFLIDNQQDAYWPDDHLPV